MSRLFDGARHLLPVSEREALEKGLRKMKARREGKLPSLVSAWPKFNDAFCDGLEWRTITVVGARPGTGKTLFMDQLVSDIIKKNTNQVFRILKFQMEMVDETSAIRKFGLITGAVYNTLMSKDGKLVDKNIYQKCVEYYHESAKSDIINVIYDVCTVNEMCATIHYELERVTDVTVITIIAVLYLTLGLIITLLGLIILKENFRQRVNRITGFMMFFAGAGPIFAAFGILLQLSPATAVDLGLFRKLFLIWEFFFPQMLLFSPK